MSAMILGTAHIDYLTSAAAEYGITGFGDRAALALALEAQNAVSYAARYDEPVAAPARRAPGRQLKVEPIQVLKALNCYEYQSSNGTAWADSAAREICEAIRAVAIRRLPGYLDAEWEIAA